ncbi:thiamine pyrophosphate-binding protein [Oceaniglobus roseus]|uniref:thiamine pyrophosphate-binding protein n=1 Tax=Oceaniglobus roseus TaxID=1737570 RepID=UPI000C7ECD28|nr:thiamine pyrophosphate-binding protein [Kandeliimicrobium roseum]
MTGRPLGAQISHMLKARGVDTIFGIPGVHNIEMYRGIEEAGITHVLARHEQGAGFMADGYARATGRPGVAYVITGPGLCNAMTPLGQSYSDSVPVLMLSSCLDETAAARGQLHQMRDQRAAAATVCDWSEEALSAQAAYALIDRALGEFRRQRPRPKHIQVGIRRLGAAAPGFPAAPAVPDGPPFDRAVAQPRQIARLVNELAQAERPAMIFGGGAREGWQAARALARRAGAVTFTSYAGRGISDPDSALDFGGMLARPGSAAVLGEADVVVAVGTTLSEVDLWRETLGHTGRLIRIDLDPEVLGQPAADIAILGDAGDALARALEAFPAGDRKSGWNARQIAALKAQWRADVAVERPCIVPVADALRACLPEDAMIFSDMTQFAYGAKEVWPMARPGHWHHPFGFGTLGYALPAAIGGAVARPGRPTVAIAGDYGFQYTVQELGTAVELGLPLPILLWDNGKLGEIEDAMVGSQIRPTAVVARNPDFPALARAYGAHAETPDTLEALRQAVTRALAADRPTLIRMTPALAG